MESTFAERLSQLPPLDAELLSLAAMITPCSSSALSERAYRLRLGGTKPISHPEVEAHVKQWKAHGWITLGSEGFAFSSELRYRILRWATTEPNPGYTALLLRALEGQSNLGLRGLTDLDTAFRASWLRGDATLLSRILRRYRELGPSEYAFSNPLLQAVSVDFDALWFESLPAGVQQLVISTALELGSEATAELGDLWPYLVKRVRDAELAAHGEMLACCAVLRGEIAVAESLAAKLDSPALRALMLWLSGSVLAAKDLWFASQAKPAVPSLPLPGILGLVPLLLKLAHGESDAGVRRLVVALGRSPSLVQAASPVLKNLVHALKAPQDVEKASHVGARLHYVELATPLLRALYAAWHLSHPYELTKCAADCREFSQKAAARGYIWLAAQFEATRAEIEKKRVIPLAHELAEAAQFPLTALGGPFLVALRKEQQPWEQALNALTQLGNAGVSGRPRSGAERLIWVIHPVQRLVEPMVQRYSDEVWTAGRAASLRQLLPGGELRALVAAEDERVLRRVDREGTSSRAPATTRASASKRSAADRATSVSDEETGATASKRATAARAATSSRSAKHVLPWDEALPALAEHPRVFLAGERLRAIELVLGQCRVRVVREPQHVSVRAEPLGVDFAGQAQETLLCREGARWVVYAPTAAQREALNLVGKGLDVPLSGLPQLEAALQRLGVVLEVHVGWAPEYEVPAADSRLWLRIVPMDEQYNLACFVRPLGIDSSLTCDPGAGEIRATGLCRGVQQTALRDLTAEKRNFEQLLSRASVLSGREQGSYTYCLEGTEELLALVSELKELAPQVVVEWPRGEPISVQRVGASAQFHGGVSLESGWFLVDGRLRLENGAEVYLGSLLNQLRVARSRFLPLGPGTYVELDDLLLRQLQALLVSRQSDAGDGPLRVPTNALSVLQLLAEQQTSFQLDEASASFRQTVESVFATDYPPPEGFTGTLRHYQVEAYQWLRRLSELGFGACLADDMGLGKTPVAIAVLLARAKRGPALVVAPTSVCHNWVREGTRFASGLVFHEYGVNCPPLETLTEPTSGANAPSTCVVVSFGMLLRDLEKFRSVRWSTVVVDEAQFIKNAGAQRSLSVCTLEADARIALTGTPIENQPSDLFGIFRFLNPGLLGNARGFEARFGQLTQAPDAGRSRLHDLRLMLSPFILRRLKAQVLSELPPLTVIDEQVEFTDNEQLLYDKLREEIRRRLKQGARHGRPDAPESGVPAPSSRIQVLTEITRLRQFCCDPRLVYSELTAVGSKMAAVLERIFVLHQTGRQVLVFSQFVTALALLRSSLTQAEVSFSYLDGSTERAARQRQIDAFQSGEQRVFLISLKAGGFGLNLTAADSVIHLDPWWNPAVEAQATDRAHRSGQQRPVTAYRYVVKGSLETRILELHERKLELADTLLEGGNAASQMSADELVELLELER